MKQPHRRIAGLLIAASLVVAGCSEDMALAQDFIAQWAADHVVEIAAAGVGVPIADPYTQAALDAGKPIKDMVEAEEIMAEGRVNEDPVKMDKAIKIRPKDWTFRLSRANLALQTGDMATFHTENAIAAHESVRNKATTLAFYTQDYAELTVIDKKLGGGTGSVAKYKSYAQCIEIYGRLIGESASENPPPGAEADYATWLRRRQDCAALPH